ncbi:N-acetyl-gamma-glutamyl-phosphate reductase [Acidipropionibacterium timonense]|uniref:N-acetyl-gamma-glutamyl-phosphate reductase n=1 Tax=Acidipropionibacterium timonense TaxID=2161818 RepID=UPI00102FA41C|nr:N-acetyl-gamma-glutamyl-phosphate reductase [Acidipropionibacterium timonense]
MRMTAKAFTVAVAGASGYAGAEVARLVAAHPRLVLGALAAHSNAGQPIESVLGQFTGTETGNRSFTDLDPALLSSHDAVVLALPHGASAALAARIEAVDPHVVLVDAGADFRLADSRDWQRWYGSEHAGTWAYGLPELVLAGGGKQRDALVGVTRIAGPGCNASAMALALAPLVRAGLVDPHGMSAVLPVGTSGAGRKARTEQLFAQVSGGARPYAVGGAHRHVPEVLQSLRMAGAPQDASLAMTPVLVPMARGIVAVCTARTVSTTSTGEALAALHEAYDAEPFVTVLPAGRLPDSHDVLASNAVHISAEVDPDSGVTTVIAALDNLVKGTAGAIVQCLNIALGLPEATGLPRIGVTP